MQIVCKTCKYALSKIEISMQLIVAVAGFMQEILPYLQKRNMMDDIDVIKDQILLSSANILKIKCSECNAYQEWIAQE